MQDPKKKWKIRNPRTQTPPISNNLDLLLAGMKIAGLIELYKTFGCFVEAMTASVSSTV